MVCENCGKEVNENNKYCPECGTIIHKAEAETENAAVLDTNTIAENNSNAVQVISDSEGTPDLTPIEPVLLHGAYLDSDKKTIKMGVITIAVGLLVLIITLSINSYTQKNHEPPSQEAYEEQMPEEDVQVTEKDDFSPSQSYEDPDDYGNEDSYEEPDNPVTTPSSEITADTIGEKISAVLSGYYDAYYRGDVDAMETYAYPVSSTERTYIETINPYLSGYQCDNFIYQEGVNEGDYLVYAEGAMLYRGIDTPYPIYEFFYLETDMNGTMHINNLYSPYNMTTRESLDGWDEQKCNLLVAYSENDEISAEMETVRNNCQTALSSDHELEQLVNELPSVYDVFPSLFTEDNSTEYQGEYDAYILPYSSIKELTEADLQGLSKEQLRLARNEIYARHGRTFQDETLQAYFDAQDWYVGSIMPEDFNDTEILSELELNNARFIIQHEQ